MMITVGRTILNAPVLIFFLLRLLYETCYCQPVPAARVVIQPVDKTVGVGETVFFSCSFSSPVQCVWFRRGQPIDISLRYHLPAAGSALSSNCSLMIEHVADIDFGDWRCGTRANSQTESVYTDFFYLYKRTDELKVVVGPGNVSAVVGAFVDLQCLFSLDAKCAWTRRQHKVDIGARYFFVDGGAISGKTKDCSITIAGVQELDFGDWQCMSEGSSAAESVKSVPAWITQIINSGMADHQVITMDEGTKQTIQCVSAMKGTLVWEFRGHEMESWSNYSNAQSISVGDKSGFYRCSVAVDGSQSQFVHYQIIVKPTETTFDYTEIVYVAVLCVIVVVITAIIVTIVIIRIRSFSSEDTMENPGTVHIDDTQTSKSLLDERPS